MCELVVMEKWEKMAEGIAYTLTKIMAAFVVVGMIILSSKGVVILFDYYTHNVGFWAAWTILAAPFVVASFYVRIKHKFIN